jgi:hypothetical protein
MKTALLAAAVAVAFALPAASQTYEIGGRIVQPAPRAEKRGFYVVEIPNKGIARILEIVEDPNDATQVLTPSPCGGFVPLTTSGGSRCIQQVITIQPGAAR